jgi:maleate cis-trans isomerase
MSDGWRGKLGFLVPAPGIQSSREMTALCPRGVLPIFATTTVRRSTVEGVREGLERLEDGVGQLASASVDAIVHVAAMPSVILGPEEDEQILRRAASVTDIPVILAMRAAVQALSQFRIKSVAAVVPLASEMVSLVEAYLRAHQIQVLSCPVLGLTSSAAVHELTAGVAYRLAKEACRLAPDAEGILLLGGGWPTLDIISALEADTGKFTVTTNTAVMWAALKQIGVREPLTGFGRLLES